MRLLEMAEKPAMAGAAKIVFAGDKQDYPKRVKDTIYLPPDPRLELFPLDSKFVQFLAIHKGTVWFGGTDEMPFLVRLSDSVHNDFMSMGGNPEKFYQELVPHSILELAEFTNTTYKRQGDIFALPLGVSWEKMQEAKYLLDGKHYEIKDHSRGPLSVFGTRHNLRGVIAPVKLFGKLLSAVEGTIEAPDHSPLVLMEPHAIAQTRNLYEPQDAD